MSTTRSKPDDKIIATLETALFHTRRGWWKGAITQVRLAEARLRAKLRPRRGEAR